MGESLLHGRYLINSRLPRMALRGIDEVLEHLGPRRGGALATVPASPRRVLLAIGGHLGDAIMATSAIAVVRQLLPEVEVGVLLSSWGRCVIEGNPLVSRLHFVDHWYLNRTPATRTNKIARYLATRRQAGREILAARYDLAIDLYPYFPNSALLLNAAQVPVRVGYTSGGFGPLYTHPVDFEDGPQHTVERDARVIAEILGRSFPDAIVANPADRVPHGGSARLTDADTASAHPQLLRWIPDDRFHYHLPPMSDTVRSAAREKIASVGIAPGYIVAHMSAATPEREWGEGNWRQALDWLVGKGHQVVMTGLAGRGAEAANRIATGLPRCINLCGRLTWDELTAVVSGASLVLSVDTAVAHVAAALDVPNVTLMATIARPEQWRPYGAQAAVLANPMPCAPCFTRGGCAHMSCVRGIRVDEVVHTIESQLREP